MWHLIKKIKKNLFVAKLKEAMLYIKSIKPCKNDQILILKRILYYDYERKDLFLGCGFNAQMPFFLSNFLKLPD